ncbi:MAG: hypothetical protein IT370_20720 [Deltaproteobacteria bacterium]|nr:hypothetical protein [Deltaproteobacteria bacterium]
MLAAALLIVTCLGFAFPALILREGAATRDARIFAVIGVVDATTSAMRAVLVLMGYHLGSPEAMPITGVASVVISYYSLAFAWSFPLGRPLPRRLARVIGVAGLLTIASFWLLPGYSIVGVMCSSLYFTPIGVLIIAILVRNFRDLPRSQLTSARIILIALGGRWIVGLTLYTVLFQVAPRAFAIGLTIEATLVVALSLLAIGYAVLRDQLFRIRGAVAELIVFASAGAVLLLASGAVIEVLLSNVSDPTLLRAGLMAAALVPAGLVALGSRLRPRLEASVLAPLDPRRALRAAVTERVLRATDRSRTPAELLELTLAALVDMSATGEVRFLRGPAWPQSASPGQSSQLGPALAAHLLHEDTTHLLPGQVLPPDVAAELRGTSACLLVPVRVERELLGALAIGASEECKATIDRDTVMAAAALSRHLALRLQNWALYAELEESRRLATLGSFAAAIAHDLRTPLTSVQMNVQILRGKVQLPADDMEYFDIAETELRRLNAHISELLDFAKPVRLDTGPHDLGEVADDAARGIEAVLAERKLTLSRELSPDLPAVRCDMVRLRQILINLLDNAAKASPPGSAITIRTHAAPAGMVAIEVADTGKGIDAESLPRIFEPFFTTRPDGTGLGLAIVHKLVRAHQGEIEVKSVLGAGSTFTVLLPAAT